MRKVIQRLTDSSTWSASADLTAINIPRLGWLTEFTIRANITATLTAAAFDDYFRRVIQNIKIEGDGRTYLGLSGTQMSRMLSLWGETIHGMPTIHSNGAGIALAAPDVGSTTFRSVFKFHPGSNPRDPFDLTAIIPANKLSVLQVKLTTTANGVVDSGGAITAGTFNYEAHYVLDAKIPRGMMIPQGYTHQFEHTANVSDFGHDIDIPGGAFLRSIILLIQDDTGTVPRRKDDEVVGIKIKRPKVGDFILEQNIYELKQAMCARYGLRGIAGDVGPIGAIATIRPGPESLQSMVPAGFLIVDMRQFAAPGNGIDPLYGMDLRPFQTGDLKMGLTVENYAAGDDTFVYWDQLLPISEDMIEVG